MARHTVSGTGVKTLHFPDGLSYQFYLDEQQAANEKWVALLKEYKDPIETPIGKLLRKHNGTT